MKSSIECAEPGREPTLKPPRVARHLRPRRATFRFRPAERRGVSAVEFAVVAPLFILLVLGVIEFGRAMMVKQIITNAAREGARRAIIETATEAEVKQVVNDYLANASVSGATVSVTPASLSTLGLGDPVTVQVSVSCNTISWTPAPWFLKGKTLSESTTMRAERLQ